MNSHIESQTGVKTRQNLQQVNGLVSTIRAWAWSEQ